MKCAKAVSDCWLNLGLSNVQPVNCVFVDAC